MKEAAIRDIIKFFDSKDIIYNIEIQYEYENGEWRDEEFFVHPRYWEK
jgi:hypothetical protein